MAAGAARTDRPCLFLLVLYVLRLSPPSSAEQARRSMARRGNTGTPSRDPHGVADIRGAGPGVTLEEFADRDLDVQRQFPDPW